MSRPWPALLLLLLPACAGAPCAPVKHGREPLGGIWKLKAGDDPAWARPDLDDSGTDWRVIDVPGGVKEYLPRDTDTCWLRVRFPAPAAAVATARILHLGEIDGSHEIYLNGSRISCDGGRWCTATFPAATLLEENALAVRVAAWQGDAGIVDGPVVLGTDPTPPRTPAPFCLLANAHGAASYDPDHHRLIAFSTGGQALVGDAHFILRTRVREYDLSRIPEAEIEALPGGRGVRTLHILEGEQIRFEARYFLPDECPWPVLAVVGEASGGKGPVDIDLVYHLASPTVVGTGGLRTLGPKKVAWGRLFVHAPQGAATVLPEAVKTYNTPEGAFELLREELGRSGPHSRCAPPGAGSSRGGGNYVDSRPRRL